MVLGLDLLALEDITTGSEESLAAEYGFLAVSVIWFALVFVMWRRADTERRSP